MTVVEQVAALNEQQLAAVEATGTVFVSAGAGTGKTSMLVERYVRAVCDQGLDVDSILVISAKTHHMKIDYSGFEGMKIAGRPSVVTVRGQVAVRDGTFVGTPGRGQLLRREPTHF